MNDSRDLRREGLKRDLRAILEQTLDERVARYLEVAHQGIIPNHHFAAASTECIDLYRDGYSLSAVMVSEAVTEGIWRFVLERNQIQADHDRPAVAASNNVAHSTRSSHREALLVHLFAGEVMTHLWQDATGASKCSSRKLMMAATTWCWRRTRAAGTSS